MESISKIISEANIRILIITTQQLLSLEVTWTFKKMGAERFGAT
jgi:hypothetical protein